MKIEINQLTEQDKTERKLPRLSFEINKDDLMAEFNEKMKVFGLASGSVEYEVLKQTYEKTIELMADEYKNIENSINSIVDEVNLN